MATKKRRSNTEESPPVPETNDPQPLYLMVAVMHIRPDDRTRQVLENCITVLEGSGDSLGAQLVQTRFLNSLGTQGVKLGAFSTLKYAETAAINMEKRLNLYIRDKLCRAEDFHEFYILRFNANANVPCDDVTWNGTEVRHGFVQSTDDNILGITWRDCSGYKPDEILFTPKKKKFFVSSAKLLFCRIPYRDNQERMMELGLYDDEDAFLREVNRIRPYLANYYKLGFLYVRVDDLEWTCGVEHRHKEQLFAAHWL